MGLAGTGGTQAGKDGAVGPVASEVCRCGRGWKGHRTLLLTCLRPAGIPRAPFPCPRSGKAAVIGVQLEGVSGLCVKGSSQL